MPPAEALGVRDGSKPASTIDPGKADTEPGPRSRSFSRGVLHLDRGPEPVSTTVWVDGKGKAGTHARWRVGVKLGLTVFLRNGVRSTTRHPQWTRAAKTL